MACSASWRDFRRCLVLLVPLRDARIEVPAVVVEARRGSDQRGDVLLRFLLQLDEADNDVGNLHAGVVDVVLDIDGVTGGAQQAHEGIAEDGVAQMADVRGLVGIDAGVLDQNFAADIGCAFAGVVGDRDALAAGQRLGRDSRASDEH